jgi:hypothetical protein
MPEAVEETTPMAAWRFLRVINMTISVQRIAILVWLLLVTTPVLYAQTWSTLPVDLIIPMNTSPTYPPGTPLTTTIANSGTVSNACTVGTNCYFSSIPAGALEVGANNACTNLGPVQMNGAGGTLYPAQSLNYNNYAHLDSANSVIGMFSFSGGVVSTQNFAISVCLALGWPAQPGSGNDWDMIMLQDLSGTYADMQFNAIACNNSTFGVRIETHNVNPKSPCIPLTNQQPYYFSMNWDSLNGVECLFAWTPQGIFLGNSCIADSSTIGTKVTQVRLFSNENGTNSGTYSKYQNVMMRWSSASPTGIATFTNGSTIVTGSGFVADNSWNHGIVAVGGVFYTIASVQSSTQLTLASSFSGTTGNASYAVELPLFWTSSATVQPPTNLTVTVH